jgi:excisionase family DNA binding protein
MDEREEQLLGAFAAYPPMLTAGEVAELLSLSTQEIRRLTREGSLPGRRVGKAYRYFRDDVVRWLDSQPASVRLES